VPRKSKETEVQAAICDYLALKGYLFSRTNNSPIYDKTRGAFRALPKYTRRGWPDICLISRGTFYGIEVKAEKGRLSPEQEELGNEITKHGGVYVIARSIDDVQGAGL
jgi:VRR-NUC domain